MVRAYDSRMEQTLRPVLAPPARTEMQVRFWSFYWFKGNQPSVRAQGPEHCVLLIPYNLVQVRGEDTSAAPQQHSSTTTTSVVIATTRQTKGC